jgi:hypothetical protein
MTGPQVWPIRHEGAGWFTAWSSSVYSAGSRSLTRPTGFLTVETLVA